MLPTFITGNQNKADYLARTLGIPLTNHALDLDEIQSANPQDVIAHKVLQAYGILGVPVLVEDTSLGFNALHGLPGPFVKFFVETGLTTMCRMLDGFPDRTGFATATYGYHDGTTTQFFTGRIDGTIATHPRGTSGYGWDAIFEPAGYGGRTRAELEAADDLHTYMAMRDTAGLRAFLTTND